MRVQGEVSTAELPGPLGLGTIDAATRELITSTLAVARDRLGMDVAWLAEFEDGRKVFRLVEGDRDDWETWEGTWMPETESYCKRMLDGRIPNAIPDTSREPEVADLDVTHRRDIRAYVGVPLVLPNGELRGAFCCARDRPVDSLDDRDVRFLQVLARLVGDDLARRETAAERAALEVQAASTEALTAALQARDEYTSTHSRAVVELATAVARRLGLEDDGVVAVGQVALLHDIGKVGIPDELLNKPGRLTESEWEVMRRHPGMGADIVAQVETLAHLAPAIRAEHERWDGGGYPDGLAGEAIPVESRITLACDGFHAMVSDRPYRPAMGFQEALDELERCAGSMFWPEAVTALREELLASQEPAEQIRA